MTGNLIFAHLQLLLHFTALNDTVNIDKVANHNNHSMIWDVFTTFLLGFTTSTRVIYELSCYFMPKNKISYVHTPISPFVLSWVAAARCLFHPWRSARLWIHLMKSQSSPRRHNLPVSVSSSSLLWQHRQKKNILRINVGLCSHYFTEVLYLLCLAVMCFFPCESPST